VQRLTKIWILWLVFISVPGSGLLLSDGIPFTSRLELAVFLLSLLAVFSKHIRAQIERLLSIPSHLIELIPISLVCLIFVKVFSFTALPLSNGFESCYQSIYSPNNEIACEKSYDYLFGNDDDINSKGSLTRVEPKIDFRSLNWDSQSGASNSTWKLPFANDYPRLSAPWLDRLPFTAQFGTIVKSDSGDVLPISFTGEIKITVNGQDLGQFTSYKSRNTVFIPLSSKKSVLKIAYRFSDDNKSTIPDVAPKNQGPWAHLQIFNPTKPARTDSISGLVISGWTFNPSIGQTPKQIVIKNSDGMVIDESELFARSDVSLAFSNPLLLQSGFNFEIRNESMADAKVPLQIHAVYESTTISIGQITNFDSNSVLTPRVEIQNSDISRSDISVERRVFEQSIGLLHGHAQTQPSGLFSLLNALINFAYLLISAFLIAAVLTAILKNRITSAKSMLVAVSLLMLSLLADLPFSIFSFLCIFGIAIFLISNRKRINFNLSVLLIPMLFVAERVIQQVLKLIGLGNIHWWNFLLWRSRDSDWFVGQGYARQILTETSLRGGEGVFYFQPGVRYLLFVQHVIFGDNDVVFAFAWILMLVFGILKIFSVLLKEKFDIKIVLIYSLAFASLIQVIFNPAIAIFAIHQASEYPTWIILSTFFALIIRKELTVTQVYLLSFLAALSSQLRPNQAIGSIVLLLLLLLKIKDLGIANRFNVSLKTLVVWGITSSLSLAHNLHYAKTMQVFSSTGELNADFTFSELFRSPFSSELRNLVIPKIEFALSWSDQSLLNFRSFHLMQLIWFSALIIAVVQREKRLRVWTALALPFAYLVPLLPYRFDSYYPRHIVIIQLAFVISGLYSINESMRASSKSEISVSELS